MFNSKIAHQVLGYSLGANYSLRKTWNSIIEQIKRKLAMLKCKLLSHAGRLQLIKYVLNSLLLFYLSIFRIPDSVAKKIISLQKKFFWGANKDKARLVTTNWHNIQTPIELGGLGLGNLQMKNLGLLLKWWWKYSTDQHSLWKSCQICPWAEPPKSFNDGVSPYQVWNFERGVQSLQEIRMAAGYSQ